MIGKVVRRGNSVRNLLYYLFGPGKANEHINPHLVAGWGDPAALEPPLRGSGQRDFRRLTEPLELPVKLDRARGRAIGKYVWHCVVRAAPEDPDLNDQAWMTIAPELMHRTGLSEHGHEDGGVRWVAVHHGDNHIHIVATLARQDGRPVRLRGDWWRIGETMVWAERTYGLRRVARADRTAPKRPTRAEAEKSQRTGRVTPPRVALRRHVEGAAAASRSEVEFFTGLKARGVAVRFRYSTQRPGQVTGYGVGAPGDVSAGGGQVWYGGGKLAVDLTLPKLRHRWEPGPAVIPCLSPGANLGEIYEYAAAVARQAANEIRAGNAGSADASWAAADVLTAVADVTGNPEMRRAADWMMRAGRASWGRVSAPSLSGQALRTAAYLLAANRSRGRQYPGLLLVLLVALVVLVEAVAELRATQRRLLQADAARNSALALNVAMAAVKREATVADVIAFPEPMRPRRSRSSTTVTSKPNRSGTATHPNGAGGQGPKSAVGWLRGIPDFARFPGSFIDARTCLLGFQSQALRL